MKGEYKVKRIFIIISALLLFIIQSGYAQEQYRFERMWPTMEQPWYFYRPCGVAIDKHGYIYIADTENDRIRKFTSDGRFVTQWGKFGAGAGEFSQPYGVAADLDGNIYVADSQNNRIQKFSSAGDFLLQWGGPGSGRGDFNQPAGIAVDQSGLILVADSENHRIQIFTPDGMYRTQWPGANHGYSLKSPAGIDIDSLNNAYIADTGHYRIVKISTTGDFLLTWGTEGESGGQFLNPAGITIDTDDRIFVTDQFSNRIQAFASDGAFVQSWGADGSGPGEFSLPFGIAADHAGFLYIADRGNSRIQKFTTSGNYINLWGIDDAPGRFKWPECLAIDNSSSFIYIVDSENHRIQKKSIDGDFVKTWGDYGVEAGKFDTPSGIAVDSDGLLYVADKFNHRVQVFDSEGVFQREWGEWGRDDRQFLQPGGIALDSMDNVYVVDSGNHRIQKFSSDGGFIAAWGGAGSGDGEFSSPNGIAIDDTDHIYVADTRNHRIQKFDANGQFLLKWGGLGDGDAEFDRPHGLAADGGAIFVTDAGDHNIKEFDSSGGFISRWGEQGIDPGKFNYPGGIVSGPDHTIFVSDSGNHRIQKFREITAGSNNKAVIIAGGGPYEGNKLWDATQSCANFAYRTLTYQGFTRDSIFYLSEDRDLDLDGNGLPDDVDAAPSSPAVREAVTGWASGADNLTIYLVDHGGERQFRLNSAETLSASELDGWLDTVQASIPGRVIVIYDACKSGSFIDQLTPPAGKERIVITGTGDSEDAAFINQGAVSFSDFFWNPVFNGENVADAFAKASASVAGTVRLQTPQMDADGNGVGNEGGADIPPPGVYIGNGAAIGGDAPAIQAVSPPQTLVQTSEAALYADVSDPGDVARVWAVIRPPVYNTGSNEKPVLELPAIDLTPVSGNRFEGVYGGFNITGTYTAAVYAQDRFGNTSNPAMTEISVNQPLARKAVIVIGGSSAHPDFSVFQSNAASAYNAFIQQGYTDDTIYFMSPETFMPGVDGSPSVNNLEYALTGWEIHETQDMVIYLTGPGNRTHFSINETETLSGADLDLWIDTLENNIPGTVVFIYDADYAGAFLPELTPVSDTHRIVIAGAASDRTALFTDTGVSFSSFFFKSVLNGDTVRDAFISARNAVGFLTGVSADALPQLDDSGNGVGNERIDGAVSANFFIGAGVRLAADDPQVAGVSPDIVLPPGQQAADFWVSDISVIGSVGRVWAVISSPDSNDPGAGSRITVPMVWSAQHSRYEGICDGFSSYGTYVISILAEDTDGNISSARTLSVYQPAGPDIYEDDDTRTTAGGIVINNKTPQRHNFHDPGDEDWIEFYGVSGKPYAFNITGAENRCEPVIELYTSAGSLIGSRTASAGQTSLNWDWACPMDGVYSIRIRNVSEIVSGEETGYAFEIYPPIAPFVGYIKGVILDSATQTAISGVNIVTSASASALSRPNGAYRMIQEPGVFDVSISAPGYLPVTLTGVEVSEGGSTLLDITLNPLIKDTDGDGIADDMDNCPTAANADQADSDADGAGDACDGCPMDGFKLNPGICGCGVRDVDTNQNGVVDCLEEPDSDGDGVPDVSDQCPNDPHKTDPGQCGCGAADTDTNRNGIADCKEGSDSDGDGVSDMTDGCPNDPNKSEPGICGCGSPETDRDHDGVPDCNDDCPDDPLKTVPGRCGCGVSETDTDGDGVPDCLDTPVIEKPELIYPADGDTDVPVTATLTAGDFISTTGAAHSATHWRISGGPDFSNPVLNLLTSGHLTTLPVPALLLDPETDYYLRVRFYDDGGGLSEWSDPAEFMTGAGPDTPIYDTGTDLDGNGIQDYRQSDISCVHTQTGDSVICLKVDAPDCAVESMMAVNPDSIPESPGGPEVLPMGMVNARIRVANPGGTVGVMVFFSREAPPDTRWYFYDPVNGWDQKSNRPEFISDRTTLHFAVTDGETGDIDGSANGVIIFSGGPGTPPLKRKEFNFTAPDDDVDGIGCFIRDCVR